MASLSALEARRIALAAQGFGAPPARRRAGVAAVRRVADLLRVIQIDPINVLVRSQYLPFLSRLGPYPPRSLDELAYERHELFEYVGHEWSLVPVALHPLLRWRMAAFEGDPRWTRRLPTGLVDSVLAEVTERGSLTPAELSEPGKRGDRFEGAAGKQALTWLTQSGRVSVAGRRGLAQVYDLTERVIPAHVMSLPTPERDDARGELLTVAAAAMGVGTAKDLADFFKIGMGVPGVSERTTFPGSTRASRLVADLADDGRLVRADVEGWKDPGFLHPDAPPPAPVAASALLSPFDSLIWERDRARRLFGFSYRSEIYTPAAKREYGYYVLPFLLGESLVARVDVKADRATGTLLAPGAFAEPGADLAAVADALAADLVRMADWLGLDRIEVGDRGDLAPALRARLARSPRTRRG